jgi:hypothetical protein
LLLKITYIIFYMLKLDVWNKINGKFIRYYHLQRSHSPNGDKALIIR